MCFTLVWEDPQLPKTPTPDSAIVRIPSRIEPVEAVVRCLGGWWCRAYHGEP